MEQAERAASRSQHVVQFAPRSSAVLARVLVPALERVDATRPSVQALVITSDAESAVVAADVARAAGGAQGIELLPVTAAGRAARILATRPVHAIAGPAREVQALLQRSALKLDTVKTVILAWPDDPAATPADVDAALEAVFADLPRESARILLARRPTPRLEALAERYLWNARRLDVPGAAQPTALPLRYVTVSAAARPAILRQLLDELDPPSAAIVTHTAASTNEVAGLLSRLGYTAEGGAVRVASYDAIPAAQTIVLYDAPAAEADLAAPALGDAVHVVALIAPRDLPALREMAPAAAPLALRGVTQGAHDRERALRTELLSALEREYPSREILALEPLLDRYDPLELAAAAVRLLEAARQAIRQAGPGAQLSAHAPPRSAGAGPREPRTEPRREDRPARPDDRRGRPFQRPRRDDGDRNPRGGGPPPARGFARGAGAPAGGRPPRPPHDDSRRAPRGRGRPRDHD